MSDADRLHKVREDIKAIQADGHLDLDMVASFNSLLNLSYTPSTDINSLEQLVRYFQASLADKRESRRRSLLFLMANWTSPMVSVPRGDENRPAASGKSFYLLRGRKIENTCSIIDEESAKFQKWEESGSLAGERPLTPALDQLKALCTKLELPSWDLMIEMFKINRDRNSLAHPTAPEQLKSSGTEADITTFKSVAEENKSEVRRLEKERVIDEETCKLYCNIIDECASYEVEKVKKTPKTPKRARTEAGEEARESKRMRPEELPRRGFRGAE